MKTRAKVGGEIGANGESYRGGQFIAQTNKPKGEPQRRQARRALVWPGEFATVPEGQQAIFGPVREFVYLVTADELAVKPNMTEAILSMFGQSRASVQAVIDRLHNGERWEATR